MRSLFKSIQVGSIVLKNRIVMPAINTNYAGPDGAVTQRLIAFYERRSAGGAGLIITGATDPVGWGRPVPGRSRVSEDRYIEGLKKLTTAVHKNDAKIFMQLSHPGRQAREELTNMQPVAPSPVPIRKGAKAPRELSIEEIETIIDSFGRGAFRAKQAGFDGVEIHASAGALVSQFLSPCTNLRNDKYGGSLEKRLNFLLEIIKSVKQYCGANFPLCCRISGDEFMEGGNSVAEMKEIAKILSQKEIGLSALNVTVGWHESPVPLIQMSVPRGAFVPVVEEIKKVVSIPVIASNRINDPYLAVSIIAEGKADMVAMGRALIADPELPIKAQEGRIDEIRPCIACCLCFERTHEVQPIECSVNPCVGKEYELRISEPKKKKTILIVGGGPAGMEAASTASARGHKVILCEKEKELGGKLLVAIIPPHKEELKYLISYLIKKVQKSGVEIHLETEILPETLEERWKADEVIFAGGALPLAPDIPGLNGKNVILATDLLKKGVRVGEKVAIVGGGSVGCEVAEYLAQKGNRVVIIEKLPKIGASLLRTERWVILQRLRHLGVKMETNCEVLSIEENRVTFKKEGGIYSIEVDNVVNALGFKSNDSFKGYQVIGDARQPGRILQAIKEGFYKGINV